MKNLSIRQRLFGLIFALLFAFIGLSVFQLWRLDATSDELQALYQKDFANATRVSQLDGLLTRVDINILRMIAIGDPESILAWKNENNGRFTKVDGLIAELQANAEPDQREPIGKLQASYRKMQAGMNHQIERIEAGDIKGGGEVNRLEVKDNANATFHALEDLATRFDEQAKARLEGQVAAAVDTRNITVIALVLATAIAAAYTLLIVRRLFNQLGGEPDYSVGVVREIAAGNLAIPIATRPGDSSSLLAAMSDMRDRLREIVGHVREGSESIATSSAQIAQGNQDLSTRTEQQVHALQQTAASMEELNSTVGQNADNARQANHLARSASAVAIRGGDVVAQVVETMKGINNSSHQIGSIIGVIDGIAFQTNILALNAAVEAARAGEQGRGFAVVASEVRSLAGRSAQAAKEIKDLIGASVGRVEKGSVLVDQAGATMTEVVDAIRRVTEIVNEISAASSEQSAGVSQIGDAVSQIDQATQQNAALVHEMAAAAGALRGHSHDLVDRVAVFKLAA